MRLPLQLVLAFVALLVSRSTAIFNTDPDEESGCTKEDLVGAVHKAMKRLQRKFEADMDDLNEAVALDDDTVAGVAGDVKIVVSGVQTQVKQIADRAAAASALDCAGVYQRGQRANGEYNVQAQGGGEMRVYCIERWVVIQRRSRGDNFNRHFNDYKAGFGALSGDMWLGLDKIYALTNPNSRTLRIEIILDAKYNDQSTHWSEHRDFKISAGDEYTATVGSSRGSDDQYFRAFQTMNTGKFSASGKDQDGVYRVCSTDQLGGWWYRPSYNPRCASMNPNAKWNVNGFRGAWSNYWNGGCVTGSMPGCRHGCTAGNNVCAYWHPWLLRQTIMKLQ